MDYFRNYDEKGQISYQSDKEQSYGQKNLSSEDIKNVFCDKNSEKRIEFDYDYENEYTGQSTKESSEQFDDVGKNKEMIKKKDAIFKIEKVEKVKKGHTKERHDNLRSRINRMFFKFLVSSQNDYLKSKHIKNKKFRNLKYSITKDIGIKSVKKVLGEQIKTILSLDVSEKYSRCQPTINKITLKQLSCLPKINEKKRKRLGDKTPLLDMTMKEFYTKVFLCRDYDILKNEYGLTEAQPFYSCLEQLKETETKSYLEKLTEIAEDYVNFYTTRKPRKSKKSHK